MQENMSLADRLKDIRARTGRSLQEVADALGISKSHLWELESGKSSNPSAELLKRFSDELDVTIGWLMGEEPGDNEQLKIMFRQLRELKTADREIVQAIMATLRRQRG